jgi:hypothetical protein
VSAKAKVTDRKVDDMRMQSEINNKREFLTGLITDSIADLPEKFKTKHQIVTIPLNIMLEGREYLDKVSIDNPEITSVIEGGGEMPTSTQPDLRTVESALEHMLEHYDKIIAITVASKLSGTFNVFKMAASKLNPDGDRIIIIDSKQNSGAEGLLVLKCAKMIEAGVGYGQIVERISDMAERTKILVSVKNLITMIRGGRLGTKSGRIAEKLNIKPIVTLDGEGAGTLGGFAFSDKGSRRKILKKVVKTHKKRGLDAFCVVHVQNEGEAFEIAAEIREKTGIEALYIVETSAVTAISAGRGAVAVSYMAGKEK